MNQNCFPKIFVFSLLISWQGFCPAIGQDEDLKVIQQLRSQRKFNEVEKRVSEIQSDLTADEFAKKILLEIERIKANMAQAFEQDPATRISSLARISASIDRFVAKNFENPNIVLVLSQKGFTTLNFGELLRMEIEAGVLREGNSKVALQILREADRIFEDVDEKLAELIPSQPKKPKDNTLSQRQLISLQNQVRYKRIKSKMNRGQLYGKKDPDNMVAVISTCKTELRKILPLIDKVDDAWWMARLDYLICHRITSDFRNADILFESYPVKEAPPEIRLAFKAERVRLAIDSRQMNKAEELIASGREIDGKELADFDFAILEFFLRKKELAEDQDKRSIQETLVKIVKAIESKHGTYWGRRANMALLSSAKMFGASGSTTMIRLAQDHYRKKEFDKSIAEFENAAAAAKQELNRRLELELRFQAVTIHKSLNQHAEVVQKSKAIALEFKDTNRAAVVHHVGILSAAELARQSDRDAYQTRMEKYVGMLDFHLMQWPDHPSIGKVGFFRGEYRMANQQFVAAAEDLKRSVTAIVNDNGALDLESFEKSALLLGKTFEKIQGRLGNSAEVEAFKKQFEGRKFFEMVVEKTSTLESTLHCWGLYALEIDDGLRQVVFEEMVKDFEPKGKSLSILIRLAVNTSQTQAVPGFQEKLKLLTDMEQPDFLDGMVRDWKRANRNVRQKIANAVTEIPLTNESKKIHWKLIADCYLVLNRPDDALALLESARDRLKTSLQPRIMIARVLTRSAIEENVKKGIVAWRDILNGVKPASDEWFEAKLEIARSHHKLGDSEKALKILQLMKAIPPGWSHASKSKELDSLLEDLSK